jgi:hypothetical protein
MSRRPPRPALLGVLLALLFAAAPRAWAGSGDALIAAADPDVRNALYGPAGQRARLALDAVVDAGLLPADLLGKILQVPTFAPHAIETLVALELVQAIPGARRSIDRLSRDQSESGVRGATFELKVASAMVAEVAEIGTTVDGHEVDLLLKDGTRVEIKNDAPDDSDTLSSSLWDKAKKQLEKRGAFGDSVMLIANEPLDANQAASFRKRFGSRGRMLVYDGGVLTTQIERGIETRFDKLRRLAMAKLRPIARVQRAVGKVVSQTQRAIKHETRGLAIKGMRMVRGR